MNVNNIRLDPYSIGILDRHIYTFQFRKQLKLS